MIHTPITNPSIILDNQSLDTAFQNYKPNKDLIHIIWNLLLTDKTVKLTPELIRDNNIEHIIAILPNKDIYNKLNSSLQTSHTVIEYGDDHSEIIPRTIIDIYENEGQKINQFASQSTQTKKNVLVYCNNGYQRSLPFLCHYLIKEHSDEAPNLDKALDLILPQVDRMAYLKQKDLYLENIKSLNIF
jgi:protein-tyrosine phosphatase